jgi:hypothetical protein
MRHITWNSFVVLFVCSVVALVTPPITSAQTTDLDRTKTESEQNEALRRAHDAELENSRRLVTDFKARVKEASDLLGTLLSKSQAFQDHMKELRTDDNGKRLAADTSAFLHYIDLQKAPPAPPSDVAAKKEFVDSILKELTGELSRPNVGFVPSTKRKEETEQAIAWARDRVGILNAEEGWLKYVIGKAAKPEMNAKPLQEVIDQYNALLIQLVADARMIMIHESEKDARRIAADSARVEVIERARADADRSLRLSRSEMESMRVDFEMQLKRQKDVDQQRIADLERIVAEGAAARGKQNAETANIARRGELDAERIRLRQKCHDPEVQRILGPILAKGYWQPGDQDFAPPSLNATPMSLAKLRADGALAPTLDGVHALYKIGVIAHGTRDRSVKWGYKQFEYMPPAELEELKLAQKYLTELGEVLVSEKMLEP